MSVGAAGLWAALMAFILANTTAGENWQTIFIISTVAFVFALLLIGTFRHIASGSSSEANFYTGEDEESESSPGIFTNIRRQFNISGRRFPRKRGETPEEYRDRVRTALRRREARRTK